MSKELEFGVSPKAQLTWTVVFLGWLSSPTRSATLSLGLRLWTVLR